MNWPFASCLARPRIIAASLLLVMGALSLSCSREKVIVDRWPSYFDDAWGVRFEATPPRFAPGRPNRIAFSVKPVYSGKGHVYLTGIGGGQPVGQLLSPVRMELGQLSLPVSFAAGTVSVLACSLSVATILNSIGLDFQAAFDSVLVDGVMVAVEPVESVTTSPPPGISSFSGSFVVKREGTR